MNWSLRLGRIAGIPVFIHWTFALLLVYLWWVFSHRSDSVLETFGSILLVLLLFGCVLLHELGHALAARRYGIATDSITMLPIGGLARLQSMPKEPGKEIVVALAGPAVNVVIAIVAALLFFVVSGGQMLVSDLMWSDTITGGLMWLVVANLFLVIFNLLPAFPMDGGRVLRALLAISMPYPDATRWAARVGQAMAVVFVLVGMLSSGSGNSWVLFFIALFVFIGAEAEAAAAEQAAIFEGMTVNDALQPRFRTLQETDTLVMAVNELLSGSQHHFPVLRGTEVTGVLSLNHLITAIKEHGYISPVSNAMRREWLHVDTEEPLEPVIEEMAAQQQTMLPVLRKGRLIGILTADNIRELVMVRSALRDAAPIVTPPVSPIAATPPAPDTSAEAAKS